MDKDPGHHPPGKSRVSVPTQLVLSVLGDLKLPISGSENILGNQKFRQKISFYPQTVPFQTCFLISGTHNQENFRVFKGKVKLK